jgi:RNA polymerase sigma-70 factor (sigma-E family)
LEFDEYVRLRGASLVRLGRLLTGDQHLGEDLAQDVLARAFVRWKKIANVDSPEAYLRRMLVNAAISRSRLRSSGEIAVAEHPDRPDRPIHGDLSHEAAEREAMWSLVRSLPPKQRAAVVLRFYEDLDDSTIATLLDCTAVTVRTQVKRALSTLRTRLNQAQPTGTGERGIG